MNMEAQDRERQLQLAIRKLEIEADKEVEIRQLVLEAAAYCSFPGTSSLM